MQNKEINDIFPIKTNLILEILKEESIDDIKQLFQHYYFILPEIKIQQYKSEPDLEDLEMGCTTTQYYEIIHDDDNYDGEFNSEFEAYRYGIIKYLFGL